MLTQSGIVLLDALITRREATPRELAEVTGYSQEHLYRILDTLHEDGLTTESRGPHNQRRIQASDVLPVEAYRHLVGQLGHVHWSTVLSPATLRVCWYLDEPRRVTRIAERLRISRQAVHTALAPLKGRAMLSPAGPEYALRDELESLRAFAHAVVTYTHRQRVRTHAPSATVAWCDPERALVRVQRAEETETLRKTTDWQMTGLAKYRDFGLDFYLSGQPAFWYIETGTLSAADVVCHTLALDADSRRVSYAMLLIETAAIEKDTLLPIARWYELESLIEQMYGTLTGRFEPGERTRLPSETEYTALKQQYGFA